MVPPALEPWTPSFAPRTGEPQVRCHSVWVTWSLWLSYSVASDTKTGKHTSNAEAFSHLHSEVGGPPVLQKTLAIFLSLQSSRLVQPCSRASGAGRNSSVKSQRLPLLYPSQQAPRQGDKESQEAGGGGKQSGPGEHPVPSFLLLPLELRQEYDPSWDFWGALWPP